jgi:hypothetical protein
VNRDLSYAMHTGYGTLHGGALHDGTFHGSASQALAGEDVNARAEEGTQVRAPMGVARTRAPKKLMDNGDRRILYFIVIVSALLIAGGVACAYKSTHVPIYMQAKCNVTTSSQVVDDDIQLVAVFTCGNRTLDITYEISFPWQHGDQFVMSPPSNDWLIGTYLCGGFLVAVWLAALFAMIPGSDRCIAKP